MRNFFASMIVLLILLSACNKQTEPDYYFSLMGESETWELTGYEIVLTDDGLKVGNGKLIMKNEDKYDTDSFSFNTYVVQNADEDRIHAGSVAGQTDIAEQTTGTIEGEDGYSFTLEDVEAFYMTVQW